MATRGCVAVGTVQRWEGVYNHNDSYPGCLGAEVYRLAKNQYDEGQLGAFCSVIGRHSRWENIVKAAAADLNVARLTSEKANPLHIEWVYVIQLGTEKLHVLAGVEDGERYVYKRVVSIPFNTRAEVNWLMIQNFKDNPTEFNRNLIFSAAALPKTSFERILEDDDL